MKWQNNQRLTNFLQDQKVHGYDSTQRGYAIEIKVVKHHNHSR